MPSLTAWFKQAVLPFQPSVKQRQQALLVVHVFRCLAMVSAYCAIASILAGWVVASSPASTVMVVISAAGLFAVWVLQGLSYHLTRQLKLVFLSQIEQQLITTFAQQQHALVRQHDSFYWQTLWLKHLPALANWFAEYRVQQMVAVLLPVIVLSVLAYFNGLITAGLLVTLPVVPLFMVIVGKGAAAMQRKHFAALTRLGSLFLDRLYGLPMLQALGAQVAQQRLLQRASMDLNQKTMRVVGLAFLSNTVLDFFATLSVALVAVFIGFSLLGEIAVGPPISLQTGLSILLVVPLLLSEMKALGQIYHQKAEAEAAQHALLTLLGASDTPKASMSETPWLHQRLLNFRVETPRLTAECLDIHRGDWIHLSGDSGSGKTVLLEALAGMRPASEKLTGSMVMLTQHALVLPGSVRDNLCLDIALDDARLYDVIQKVELDEWLSTLDAGLDTLMGESPPLSGGQAQRLAIARLLLRDATIWLLDEPTAHLSDVQHERVCALIRSLCAGKTVIWASHKPLPLAWFDRFWRISQQKVTLV